MASESVCLECNIIGSPLESLYYLSRGGMGGTLSARFGVDASGDACCGCGALGTGRLFPRKERIFLESRT